MPPEHDASPVDWSKVYIDSSRRMETAGNIASGHGEHALATGCWRLAQQLRTRALEERKRGGQV